MANHSNPYQNYQNLKKEDIIIQLRSMVAEEFEAANLYQQLAEVISDNIIKQAILDIADEELVHAGEFSAMIDYFTKEDGELLLEGMEEAEENLEKE